MRTEKLILRWTLAKDCRYITGEQHVELTSRCREIGKMLGSMVKTPGAFLTPHR